MVFEIKNGLLSKGKALVETAKASPVATVGVGAGIVGVSALAGAVALGARKRTTTRRRTRKTRKPAKRRLTKRQKQVRKIKRRPGRQTPYTAGARKDRSRTRIRYTKNGQPYTLSGKGGRAKFISKRAAKARRRR